MQKKKLESWDFITNKRLKYAKLINECLQFLLLIPFTIVLILSGIFYCKISAVDLMFGSISVFCFCILQKNIHRCLSLLYLFLFNAIMFLSFVIYG